MFKYYKKIKYIYLKFMYQKSEEEYSEDSEDDIGNLIKWIIIYIIIGIGICKILI